jgi:fumarate hydratase class II
MPGKVNPVIPEAVAMACVQVMGNHSSISIAGQCGNFQLHTMMPLIANNSLQNLHLLTSACRHLGEKAIAGFTVNTQVLSQTLARNPILVTALNPIVGYEKAALIAKRAYAENRPVLDVAKEMTDLSLSELKILLDPVRLTKRV